MVRATSSNSLVTFLRHRHSTPFTSHNHFCATLFRFLTTETNDGGCVSNSPDAKDQNLIDFAREICRFTRTKPRWENTLLSQYPSFDFKDRSFFLLYLTQQRNAFLSLRFFHWLCSHCGFSPDQSSCTELFDVLVGTGACKAAKALLDCPGFTPEPRSLERYIRCLSSGGMVEDALDVFVELKNVGFRPSVETWKASFLGCLKVGRTDLVWKLYKQMMESGSVIDVETVEYLINAYCTEDNVSKGYELLRQVLESGLCPDKTVFNKLIRGFCKNNEYARVTELLHIMIAKSCNPDIYTYQEVINGLLKHNNPAGFRVFNDLKDRGYFPNRVVYTTVIKGLCEKGLLGEARKLWFEMIQKGFHPDKYTYNVMIHGYCKAVKLDMARKLFQDMCRRGYVGEAVCYNTIIKGFCENGSLGEARKLLFEMIEKGFLPAKYAYDVIMQEYCKAGKLDQAMELFQDMYRGGYLGDTVCYNTMISVLCFHGKTDDALTLFREMAQKAIAHDLITYNTLIKGLCSNLTIEEMGEKGLCEDGNMVKATELFNKLLAQGLEPSVFTFGPLIKGLCKVGRTQEAIRLWKDMHDRHLEPLAITHDHIIMGLMREQNSAQALEWLQNMLNGKLEPQKKTFERMILSLSQKHRLDDVLVVLDSMFRIGYRLENSMIHYLVSEFCKENFLSVVDLCLEEILDRN